MDLSGYKRGWKIKKKRAVKQKQKQNVKQSVVVKINNSGGKRRAYKPREKKESSQQASVSVSYNPTAQDQSAYREIKEQLKELQREKNKAINKKEKEKSAVSENKPLEAIRERQQQEYNQVINKPHVAVPVAEVLQPKQSREISTQANIPKLTHEKAVQAIKHSHEIATQASEPARHPEFMRPMVSAYTEALKSRTPMKPTKYVSSSSESAAPVAALSRHTVSTAPARITRYPQSEPETKVAGQRGRPRKYKNEAERKAAAKEAARRYKEKQKNGGGAAAAQPEALLETDYAEALERQPVTRTEDT